ncbi:MAG: ATP-binding protein [Syntrophales bacterium]
MIKSLWIKFLILLLAVSVIALSAAFILRELMIRDFREFLEGEREDRVYWVMADLETAFEKYQGWNNDVISEDTVWARMLGLEIRLLDDRGRTVMDTEKALAALSPLTRAKILAASDLLTPEQAEPYLPYPLFLAGNEIGRLEVRFLKTKKESVFVARSNRLLLFSLVVLGGLALALSVIASRNLTRPIKRLAAAAAAVGEGDLKARVPVAGKDEISELSETFNRMAQSLETQEVLRKKVLSNTAHELRTPLSAMQGELEGMIDGLIPADRQHIGSLYEETGRLKNILNGMEDLAQAQASALTLKKQHFDLCPFLSQIISRFDMTIRDKGTELNFECELGLIVYADPDRLSQIIVNLLSNALKAVDGGGNVTVGAVRKGAEILIEVQDMGTGIKPEDLPFIFERFFKASEGGLGLGLAIVKELTEAHGGRIEAKSEYGQGSIFTLYLPSQ